MSIGDHSRPPHLDHWDSKPCIAFDPIQPPNPRNLVIFVKQLSSETLTIPWPVWECATYIKQKVFEQTGIPIAEQRLIFAGAPLQDYHRHSGMQFDSTVHLVRQSATS